jgi:hypothetical protein
MNFGLEKVEKLSGSEASVYAVILAGQPSSVFEQFLAEYQVDYLPEIKDIINRLRVIGHKTGAREQFFKPFEGSMATWYAPCMTIQIRSCGYIACDSAATV